MAASNVMEHFNVLEHVGSGFGSCAMLVAVQHLGAPRYECSEQLVPALLRARLRWFLRRASDGREP